MSALTRCRLGMKRRLVMAVTCVPMPPFFFALPLRQMWLPFIGPVPVISQNFDIKFLIFQKERRTYQSKTQLQALFLPKLPFKAESLSRNSLPRKYRILRG